jgi:hypothetical protein
LHFTWKWSEAQPVGGLPTSYLISKLLKLLMVLKVSI